MGMKSSLVKRLPKNKIIEQSDIVKNDPELCNIAKYFPETLVVLNEQRQIVYSNINSTGDGRILGQRPGEFLDCIHKFDNPEGCGTSDFCQTCGALQAILKSLQGQKDIQECRLKTEKGESFDYRILTSPIQISGTRYAIVVISNINDEKRRKALERIFFHDVLNTAAGIKGITHLLTDSDPEEREELITYLAKLSDQLIDEIQSQRQLTMAENNELMLDISSVFIDDIFNFIVEQYTYNNSVKSIAIKISPDSKFACLRTDAGILRRILGNIVKNAIEASPKGASVVLSCTQITDDYVQVKVNNAGVIPADVQLQIFNRSFSTKGANRGLGTYSIKLLTERYLKGRTYFESNAIEGTSFYLELPKEIPEGQNS